MNNPPPLLAVDSEMIPVFALLLLISSLATSTWAHYQFPTITIDGVATGDWVHVRKTNLYERARVGYGEPVTDVNHLDMRCNNTFVRLPSDTATVSTGQRIGFLSPIRVFHHGVFNLYMARAPGNVSEWDGSGKVWFKVHEVPPIVREGEPMEFPALNSPGPNFVIPKSLPDGEYLIRMENIALHISMTEGAEFYISCGQVRVVNGGTGTPGPLVSIPGLYTGEEPGLSVDVYSPNPKPYLMPGPAVWYG